MAIDSPATTFVTKVHCGGFRGMLEWAAPTAMGIVISTRFFASGPDTGQGVGCESERPSDSGAAPVVDWMERGVETFRHKSLDCAQACAYGKTLSCLKLARPPGIVLRPPRPPGETSARRRCNIDSRRTATVRLCRLLRFAGVFGRTPEGTPIESPPLVSRGDSHLTGFRELGYVRTGAGDLIFVIAQYILFVAVVVWFEHRVTSGPRSSMRAQQGRWIGVGVSGFLIPTVHEVQAWQADNSDCGCRGASSPSIQNRSP